MRVCVLRISLGLIPLLFSQFSVAQTLDLDSFVQSILKHNPGVQKILSEQDISAGNLESSLGVDDGYINSSLSLVHSEPNQITGAEFLESDNKLLDVSYNRVFSDSGTRLSLAYGNQLTDQTPALPVGDQYYQPSFTVRLTQPLLKNSGGVQDRLNVELNQLNFKLSGLSSKETLESYITQLATLYIDWYLASRELEISKEVYQQAVEQEKLTAIKVKRQVIESYELLRSQETREDYYSRWQQAEGRYLGLMQKIGLQMNLEKNNGVDEWSPQNPEDAQLFSAKQTMFRGAEYLATSSRLKEILDSLKQQQIILLEAKDNARDSDLNLSFGYTRHGVDASLSDAHSDNLDKNDYSLMLEYKHPLGNRQASGNYQAQVASKRQLEADTRQRMIDVESNLANSQIQEAQLIIALKSSDRKIELATKKIKQEQRLYKIGKLDLFELLRDQTTQLESRLNRERLFAQLLVLRLNIGELLDRNLETYSASTKLTDVITEEQ
ncbi:MAG: TolC family protein [Gammaproteobacteria bacterium]|nr:TolC family protein [Gammaproteobacteria bacterium]